MREDNSTYQYFFDWTPTGFNNEGCNYDEQREA